jgi:DNA-binding CsgD family transcriptional regulator
MRHKRVLDVARENPDASIDELAAMVSSATPGLVERVLEAHGDPASADETSTDSDRDQADVASAIEETTPRDPEDETMTTDRNAPTDPDEEATDSEGNVDRNATSDRYPSPDDLSEKQREVLAAVAARPGATQQEIGEDLDVSPPTVSNRVNSIDGFEWSERESFAAAVFDDPPSADVAMDGGAATETASNEGLTRDSTESGSTDDPTEATVDTEAALASLEARVTDLEEARTRTTNGDSVFNDPELVHKVVHACMQADTISESDELRILKELVT